MTNALLSPEGIAILAGADLIRANGTTETIKAHHTTTFTLDEENLSTGIITLPDDDYAPLEDMEKYPAYGMILDGNLEMSGIAVKATSASATAKTITFAPTDLFEEGDVVMIDYYSEHKADAIQIDITPEQFAGYFYLEGSTLFRRQSDGADLPAELIIPNGKIQTNFSFTLASTGDPSTFDFTMDAFPGTTVADPSKKVLATLQILSADDNYDLTGGEETGTITYDRYVYNQNGGAYLGTTQEGPVTKSEESTDKTAAAGTDDPEHSWE